MGNLPPPEVGSEQARVTADRVLQGRAYVEAARPPSFRDRIFEWIGDRFTDLLNSLSSAGGRGITAWIIIGVFAALTIFLLSRLRRVRSGNSVQRSLAPEVDIAGAQSADDWLAAAVASESQGDFRTGIRNRHRALVTNLMTAGIVRGRAEQTAGEISREVAATRTVAAQPMDEATFLFKDSWYGWIQPGPAERDRFIELSRAVLETAERETTQPHEAQPHEARPQEMSAGA